MKHTHLKHLFTALLLLCATVATAHDFEVGGIYYNILSETDKTVEVTYKGDNFNSFEDEYSGSVVIPSTVSITVETSKAFNAWTSTNKSDGSTSQTTYTLNVEAGNVLKFDWSVSSESNYDWLIITLDGTEIVKKSGTLSGSYEKTFDTAGSHTLVVKYTKDGSQSKGDDEGKILNIEILSINSTIYSVTAISAFAFFYCSGLWNVKIPNSVTRIDTYAFGDCNSLDRVEIPNSVTYIPDMAFINCTNLESIEIPNSVTGIGWNAFYGCYNLTSIVIPNSVTSIGSSAFSGCTGLTSITIPNSVTSIGNQAFYGCTGLTSIKVESGNSVYDSRENCNAIIETATNKLMVGCQSSIIPNSVTSIGDYAFYECSGLTNIEIPNSVTSIGNQTFYECTGLTSITIPNSVTSIGNQAFYGCTGLTSIKVESGNSVYDSRENCNAIIETATNKLMVGCQSSIIPNSVTSIGNQAFYECSGLTSIVIGNGVTSIGDYAFYECSGLTSVEIGNSVTSIGDFAFSGCTGLTSIEIPNSVTSIGDRAFRDCDGLTSITIPNSVTSIEYYAFSGTAWYNNQPDGVVYAGKVLYEYKGTMPSNTSITIKDGTLGIADNAFKDYTRLTSIEIPNSVTSIGSSAFSGCTGLTSITSLIPADALFTVDSQTFYNVDKNACTLYVPYGAKDTYAATAGWNKFTNIVELEPTATEVTVTIGQYGNATYCSPYALDFTQVEGLKAYAATGYKSNSQVVTLTRVQTAEAGIGLFLKGEPGEYVVPVIESTDEHSLNMLVGTLEQTTVNSTEGAMSNYKFTIAEGDAYPMFYPFEDGTTLSAGKAYLQIPTAWLPATAQKSLSARFDDGETTDIDEMKEQRAESKGVYYDLCGRVVENPTSGIYVINGKKVVVK